jgi:hypothetical protein
LILRKLSEGTTEEDLLDAYPRLKVEDIQAAIRYAADTLAQEETIILAPPKKRAKRNRCAFWRMKAVIFPWCGLFVLRIMTLS